MADVTRTSTGQRRKRRNRWGDAPASASAAPEPKRSRFSSLPPSTSDNQKEENTAAAGDTAAAAPPMDAKAKALALQASIRERLAALKKQQQGVVDSQQTAAGTGITAAPPPATASAVPRPPAATTATATKPSSTMEKRAKYIEIDFSETAPTHKKPPPKKVNPYLAHLEEEAAQQEQQEDNSEGVSSSSLQQQDEMAFDDRLAPRVEKGRTRQKEWHFVEPGTFVEMAERARLKAANAEIFRSGRKTGKYVKAATMAQVYGGGSDDDDMDESQYELAPRADASEKHQMPLCMEWWDLPLIPPDLRQKVAELEGDAIKSKLKQQRGSSNSTSATKDDGCTSEGISHAELLEQCFREASLVKYCKTRQLVQHITPIQPRNISSDEPAPAPVLYLTKKELKKRRKLRRAEKLREQQDLQAAGLIPPPEPRLTLQNFMTVLGQQAVLDPSQMEQKVREQMQARQLAHEKRNKDRQLTKEQRSEKRAQKWIKDAPKGGAVHVALFMVKDMSHPYHRTKVDLNAQQHNLTGGVLECMSSPKLACVIVEGGPKGINRYIRLMTVRMKWKGGPDLEEVSIANAEGDAEGGDATTAPTTTRQHKFNPDNRCELVWTGMAVRRLFKGFVFQACDNAIEARKVLSTKGVAHYWDQVVAQSRGDSSGLQIKLGSDDEEEDHNSSNNHTVDMQID